MIERTEYPACVEVEPLLAAYVDDELSAGEVVEVTQHLAVCRSCCYLVEGQRTARRLVNDRRATLAPPASPQLRTRCAACAWTGLAVRAPGNPRAFVRRAWLPLSFAATILLAVAGVFLVGNLSPESLAAQFALDHLKCFQFDPPHITVDATTASAEWYRTYGWPVAVPRSEQAEELELLDVRRCLSTEGSTAHIFYKWHGKPLSVFVLNRAEPDADGREHVLSRFGKEAIVWTAAGRTYAVIGDGTPQDLERVAHYVQASAQVMPGERVR